MRKSEYKWRMYCFVPRQLNGINKGIQAAHSCMEYAYKFKNSRNFKEYIENDKTLIILDVGTFPDMESLYENLREYNIDFECFVEPDLNNVISSICFLADERVWEKEKYPDYEIWMEENGYLKETTLSDEDNYWMWTNFVGGEENVVLRGIIKGKRLAR